MSTAADRQPTHELATESLTTSSETAALRDVVKREVAKAIVGHEEAVELTTMAAVVGGHVLLEGPPGIAKTLLANAVAHTLGISFNRMQFTPDTTPRHIAGDTIVRMGEHVFVPGPVFTNLLLADEINRAEPRTQAALLEAMEEHHVTVDGQTHWLPSPFIVLATQNPYEQEGVHPLPESQLDRFLFKVKMEYGSEQDEVEVVRLPHTGLAPDVVGEIQPLLSPALLVSAQRELDATHVPDDVAHYAVGIIRRTRELPEVRLGASPRAALHLVAAAKANARLDGRQEVERRDVDRMVVPVLRHRLLMASGTAESAIDTALGLVRRSD